MSKPPRAVADRWLCGLLLTLLAFTLISCNGGREETLTLGGETFTMELALDEDARVRGMSGRESFPEQGGMLFVFPDAEVRHFWMYECLIDIDVIFLDSRGVITAIHTMPTEPPRREDESELEYENRLPYYTSRRPAQFAIELPAGTADRLGLRVDERVGLDLDRLKRMAE